MLLVELASMVALPLLLFAANPIRARISKMANRRNFIALIVLGAALTAFQCVVERGLQNLVALHPATFTSGEYRRAC